MPKPANRLTQKDLETLRKQLMEPAREVFRLRCQYVRLEKEVAAADAFKAHSEEEKVQMGAYTRQRQQALLDARAGNIEQMESLRAKIRVLADDLDARAEPAWAHIRSYAEEIPAWATVGEIRPKILRGEGAVMLCRLAAIVSSPDRAAIGKWLLKNLQQRKKEGHLTRNAYYEPWFEKCPGINARGFKAIDEWAQDHPNQTHTQLDRVGIERLVAEATEWRKGRETRERLKSAGVRVGELEIADGDRVELRVLEAEDLGPIGEYLGCCIGGASYVRQARTREQAFVAGYSRESGLPEMVCELRPSRRGLIMGQCQGMRNRTWEHREHMEQWVARAQARHDLLPAMTGESELPDTTTVRVAENCDIESAWTGSQLMRWGTKVEFDLRDAALGILSGVVDNVDRAYQLSRRQNTDTDLSVQLKNMVESALANSTSPAMQERAAKQARLEEMDLRQERLQRQLDEIYQLREELQADIERSESRVPRDEAERLLELV